MITRDSHGVAEPLSSKRRWSPSTWRYAIEELQPEIRTRYSSPSSSSPYLNNRSSSHGYGYGIQSAQIHQPYSSLSSYLADRHGLLFQQQKKLRDGFLPELYPSRRRHGDGKSDGAVTAPAAMQDRNFASKAKKRAKMEDSDQTLTLTLARQRNPNSNSVAIAAATEESDETDLDEEDDDSASEDAIALNRNDEKQRWCREMSPAERYFCPVCSAAAASGGASADNDCSRPPSPS